MFADYSPFTPGQPVPIELFVGRDHEIRRLSRHVEAATRGHLQVAFLAGERGIGKSSLASYVKSYAERECNMVGAHVLLGGADTLSEMARRIFERLLNESKDKKWYQPIKDLFGKSVKSVNLLGLNLTFSPSAEDLDALVRNFASVLRGMIDKLQKESKATGILLVLDDINGLAGSTHFANWIKSLVDGIATSAQMPLCLLVVGLEERRQSLIELQPSLARIFHLFEIAPWNSTETMAFFKETFERAGVTVDQRALLAMTQYAGGLPVVAHEIGEAVFNANSDKIIDTKDASRGLVNAVEIIGRKYLRQQVLDEIRSKKYRAILGKAAHSVELGELGFERSRLIELSPNEEPGTIDKFLRRMKKLGIIVSDVDAGTYRFASHIHHLFLSIEDGLLPQVGSPPSPRHSTPAGPPPSPRHPKG